MSVHCKVCNRPANAATGFCFDHLPAALPITITVTVREEGFYCNAVHGQNFICTTIQPTLDMSLASAMSWVRQEVAAIRQG